MKQWGSIPYKFFLNFCQFLPYQNGFSIYDMLCLFFGCFIFRRFADWLLFLQVNLWFMFLY